MDSYQSLQDALLGLQQVLRQNKLQQLAVLTPVQPIQQQGQLQAVRRRLDVLLKLMLLNPPPAPVLWRVTASMDRVVTLMKAIQEAEEA